MGFLGIQNSKELHGKPDFSTTAENLLFTQTHLHRELISISSKCWIPLNINHWTAEFIWTLTKLLSIMWAAVLPVLFMQYSFVSILLFCLNTLSRQSQYLSVSKWLVMLSSRLTGNEPLSVLPLNSLPEESIGRAHFKLCDRLKLEKKQRRMCRRDPGVAETLREAITMSALECQYQFRFERWNCTLEGRHRANILKRGDYYYFSSHLNMHFILVHLKANVWVSQLFRKPFFFLSPNCHSPSGFSRI